MNYMSEKSILFVAISILFTISLIFFGRCSSCKSASSNNSKNLSFWQKDDETLFLYLFDKLLEKSNYCTDLSTLNDSEKIFITMAKLEQEVNNGGFDQFFFNTNDKMNDILVSSAEAIKAYDIANLCKKALDIYSEHSDQDEPINELNECDEAFYVSTDYITALCVKFAKDNKEQFNY